MRRVSIRVLRARLSTELLDLPFEVTRNGEVIAVVGKPGGVMSRSVFEGELSDVPAVFFNPQPKRGV